MVCIFALCCVLSACHWQEARQVIAVADSLDQAEHVIHDDTAALSKAIRCLDNPFGITPDGKGWLLEVGIPYSYIPTAVLIPHQY